MDLLAIIFCLISALFCIAFFINTKKEAEKFISDPYAYRSKEWGDGYLMFTMTVLSSILGILMLGIGITGIIAVYIL
jgi:hypothetical protein